jgi:hypothetical protein
VSFLSNFLKQAAPVVAQTMPGTPIGTAALVKTVADRRAQEKFLQRTAEQHQQARQRELEEMAMGSGEFGTPGITFRPVQPQPTGFFDRLGGIASNVGNTLLSGLETALPNVIQQRVFGSRSMSSQQQPAITTITNLGAAESQGSGSIQAGMGALLPNVLGGARSLLKSPMGQVALGGGVGTALSLIGDDGKKMRITRKMRSELRMLLRVTGNNFALVGDFLGYTQDEMLFILGKRFRNDGPVVTKAALRKTKQTVRRLKSMCDMYDSLRPTATRRRTPMKRASTTLISNK